ncbi:MAG: DegT/DnrJ/EryC1/StrS family aminotransferase [Bacteroidales bacterium]
MLIKRTLPPAAAPVRINDIINGIQGASGGQAEIEFFSTDIKDYFQVKYCFLLSSGKAALTVILWALRQLSPGRKDVLIPAFTCYSVPSAIVRAGLRVNLADIDAETLNYDFSDLRKIRSTGKRFLAVICPHLFGLPADVSKIREIFDDPDLFIIEDAAQAMGGKFNGNHLGTFGDAGFFSLGRGKAFSAVEGGVIVTNNDELAGEIESFSRELSMQSGANILKLAGNAVALTVLIRPSLFWLPKSVPGLRLGETLYDTEFSIKSFSPFQAGLARNWQKRLSLFQAVRKKNVLYWIRTLKRFSWLKPIYNGSESNEEVLPLLRFPVLVKNADRRAALLKVSDRHGFGIMPAYPESIDKINDMQFANNNQTFPGSEKCASQLVTFPVHEFLTLKNRQRIFECLAMLGE